MIEDKKIQVKIGATGQVNIEALGFQGSSCKDATKGLEDVLMGEGGGVTTEKPEYYNDEENTETEIQW